MVDHPARVDAHVVGHHVAGQPDAPRPRAVAQVPVRVLAAEVVGDPVVVERVRRRDGLGVAAHPLDALRGDRPLPQPDQPQARDAPRREPVERLVRHRVERADVAPNWRDSWSSQTYVLLAMSTSRGIQAESTENRSGSSARPRNDGGCTSRPSDGPPNR